MGHDEDPATINTKELTSVESEEVLVNPSEREEVIVEATLSDNKLYDISPTPQAIPDTFVAPDPAPTTPRVAQRRVPHETLRKHFEMKLCTN